jgi:GGDEF domain-containing protein
MLVLATRVHIPAGRAAEAHGMFAEIVHVARRHGLHALLADVLTSLAHEQETAGELTDALNSLRSARAAEHRRLRADTLARLIVLEELGAGTKLPDDTEALLRRVVRSPVRSFPESPELSAPGMAVGELKWPQQPGDTPGERDAETGLLNRQGLRRRLAAARRQVRPTALTLVRLDSTPEGEPEPQQKSNDPDSTDRYSASLIQSLDRASGQAARDIAPDVLSSLAGHVRDIAPEHTELVRPEDGELAVLMPDTTREQAEQFAATLRETMSTSDWDPEDPARGVSVSTGVAQYEGTSEDAFLTAAREDLTSTDPEFDSYTDTSGYTRGRHIPSEHIADHVNTGHVNTGHVNTGHVNTGHVNTGHVNTEYADSHMERPAWQSVEPVYDMPSDDISFGEIEQRADGYTYMEQYAAMEQYAPPPEEEPEPADAEMDAYLAGFSLPEYGQQWPPSEETEPQAPKHDAASINDAGRSVLDRLGITRGGGGGRRRAPDSSEPQQCDPGQFDPDQSDQGLAGDASSSGIGEEVLAASAASASIPQPPGPDAVPGPPDSPDIPIPPDPDVDPAPPRRRAPDPSDPLSSPEVPIPPNPDIEPTTSARRLPTPPAEPRGLAAPDTDDHSSAGRRRSPTGEQEQELASSESAPESEVPVSSDVDPSAWRRKFAAQPREAPGSDATVERAARRRRPPVLPPDPPDLSDPSELMDPPVDAPESNESPRTAGRPSRLRKREKTDVGLADLLAEALVAYQSSHSDSADEDVLPVYEGLSATPDPLGPDSGRHRFPDRASAERDTH